MWWIKLSLTTLWMAGMLTDWTAGGWIHLLGITAVALVLIEETPFERRLEPLRSLRFMRLRDAGPPAGPSPRGGARGSAPWH